MTRDEIIALYNKERNYQEKVFGNYASNPKLNIASFLQFIERYVDRSKLAYSDAWTYNSPDWLINCNESSDGSPAPVETYEHLVKIFALAGAALETYSNIDVEKWRSEGVKDKWL